MWGLTLVGACLILGLFTRLASLAGIGFILLFYLCNPPFVGYFYSIPSEGSYLIVNKNLVETARARRHPRRRAAAASPGSTASCTASSPGGRGSPRPDSHQAGRLETRA